MRSVSVTRVGTNDVVIGDHVYRPMTGSVHSGDVLAVLIRGETLEFRHHQVHGQLQLVLVLAVIILELRNISGPRFTDQHGSIFVGHTAQFAHHFMYLRKFLVVLLVHVRPAKFVRSRKNGIVGQGRIFKERIYGIETKAGNATLVPEPRYVQHRLFHRGIPPVQVRLLGIKVVVIILIRLRVELPRGQAKRGKPIVWRLAGSLAVSPYIPIAVLRRAGRF